MNTILQFLVPLATALALLGLFHLVAYLHLQLSEADSFEHDDELQNASEF